MDTIVERHERFVTIPAGRARLEGILGLPAAAKAAVLFVHGTSNSRYNRHNNAIARILHKDGLATLLLDLLEERESADRGKLFDMDLLAGRILAAGAWLRHESETGHLPIGYLGVGTGAAAVLQAAARFPASAGAVVFCGGRPDLVGQYLPQIEAPTLLIAGGHDILATGLNQGALARLRCPKELIILPEAIHPFEEPGTEEEVANFARDWFRRYLGATVGTP
jgi:putative phosphoribosyl transferase